MLVTAPETIYLHQ